MQKNLAALICTTVLSVFAASGSVVAEPSGYYQVTGVGEDDMLKMRAGPGVGYKIVVGLPNGTAVWLFDCERSGSTSWCRVALKQARGLKGYVSGAYLQKM